MKKAMAIEMEVKSVNGHLCEINSDVTSISINYFLFVVCTSASKAVNDLATDEASVVDDDDW